VEHDQVGPFSRSERPALVCLPAGVRSSDRIGAEPVLVVNGLSGIEDLPGPGAPRGAATRRE
jgi:hypothetical protein